jgi:hypothetical protein
MLRRNDDESVKLRISIAMLFAAASATPGALGADPAERADEIPPLRPPITEVPPGVWEQYGAWIVLGAILTACILAALLYWLLRPRPEQPVPPGVRVRKSLQPLAGKPDPAHLSAVSRALRIYLTEVYNLPREELTTSEFLAALHGSPGPAPGISEAASDFLRQCDRRKFAPRANENSWDAAAEALRVVDLAEAERAPAAQILEKR